MIGNKKGAHMAKIDTLVQDFLAQKKIGVVGVRLARGRPPATSNRRG